MKASNFQSFNIQDEHKSITKNSFLKIRISIEDILDEKPMFEKQIYFVDALINTKVNTVLTQVSILSKFFVELYQVTLKSCLRSFKYYKFYLNQRTSSTNLINNNNFFNFILNTLIIRSLSNNFDLYII